ncbi:MAG: alpha/beta fold hydrolase [Acidimicrobiia bacterium]
MSAGKRALKVAGVTVGVAAGLAGAGYAAQRAVRRGLSNRPDPDAELLLPLLNGDALVKAGTSERAGVSERRLPSHDGGSIYVLETGPDHGTPIVLSHGVTIDSRIWVKQLATLPKLGFRLVAFDTRGHGSSLSGETGHSVENLAFDLRTVLEALDLHDAILVGHSMGGVAVQAFASRFPAIARSRVAGIVLISSLSKTHLSTTRRLRCAVQGMSDRLELGKVMASPSLGTMLARLGFGRDPLASHVELVRQMLADCDADTSREAVACLLDMDLTPSLPDIDLPTLVIGGTADVLTPPMESRRIAGLIPGARLVMIEGAGHTIMLERAEELEALLVEFSHEVRPDSLSEESSGEEPDRAGADAAAG